jgi:hypothetical protein
VQEIVQVVEHPVEESSIASLFFVLFVFAIALGVFAYYKRAKINDALVSRRRANRSSYDEMVCLM